MLQRVMLLRYNKYQFNYVTTLVSQDVNGHFDATLKLPEGTYMLSVIMSVNLQWHIYLSSNN